VIALRVVTATAVLAGCGFGLVIPERTVARAQLSGV
jgi:hypothetical protein